MLALCSVLLGLDTAFIKLALCKLDHMSLSFERLVRVAANGYLTTWADHDKRGDLLSSDCALHTDYGPAKRIASPGGEIRFPE